MSTIQSCPHPRKPASSLIGALGRSSSGIDVAASTQNQARSLAWALPRIRTGTEARSGIGVRFGRLKGEKCAKASRRKRQERSPRRPLPSQKNPRHLRSSASGEIGAIYLGDLREDVGALDLRGRFGKGAQTRARGACAPQTRFVPESRGCALTLQSRGRVRTDALEHA